jgi:hypothetical protein
MSESIVLDKINYMGVLSAQLDRIAAAFTEGDYSRAARGLDTLWCMTWKEVRKKVPNPSQVIEEKLADETVYPLPSADQYGIPLFEGGRYKSQFTERYIQERMYKITRDVMRDCLSQTVDTFFDAKVLLKTYTPLTPR